MSKNVNLWSGSAPFRKIIPQSVHRLFMKLFHTNNKRRWLFNLDLPSLLTEKRSKKFYIGQCSLL